MTAKSDKSRKWYQSVCITFSNGAKAIYIGQVAATDDMNKDGICVVDITFSEPEPMPDGMHFERMP